MCGGRGYHECGYIWYVINLYTYDDRAWCVRGGGHRNRGDGDGGEIGLSRFFFQSNTREARCLNVIRHGRGVVFAVIYFYFYWSLWIFIAVASCVLYDNIVLRKTAHTLGPLRVVDEKFNRRVRFALVVIILICRIRICVRYIILF